MERQQFKNITSEEKETCWCLVGLHDTTVTNAEALFKKNYLADHVIRFDSTGSQRSHPFQLEAAESLIVQTYARMYTK